MVNFDKLFNESIVDRKREAHSIRARTGRGGSRKGRSKAMFTSDFLTGKERRAYIGAGKVRVYNMYDTILSMEEFREKPEDNQKALLSHWRVKYQNKEIMEKMGIGSNTLYKLLDELEIAPKGRGGYKPRKKRVQDSQPPEQVVTTNNNADGIQQLVTDGLYLEYNGKFNSEQLEKIFTKLQMLTEGNSQFRLQVRLAEVDR